MIKQLCFWYKVKEIIRLHILTYHFNTFSRQDMTSIRISKQSTLHVPLICLDYRCTSEGPVNLTFGFRVNRYKTKIMIVDHVNNNMPEVTHISNCDVVEIYVYLGALISIINTSLGEVKRRMAITRVAMEMLRKNWGKQNLTKATKIKLVYTYFPFSLYAAETWTVHELEKRKMWLREMWCLKKWSGYRGQSSAPTCLCLRNSALHSISQPQHGRAYCSTLVISLDGIATP